MTKLDDLQSILLSAAAAREGGSLLPFPAPAIEAGARLGKATASLLRRKLIEERETSAACEVHRSDGELSFGLYITAAGVKAIGIAKPEAAEQAVAPSSNASPRAPTKAARVLALLRREEGATLAELVAETGWLPHTTRAALTGLRKKGHVLDKRRRGEETCYRIATVVDGATAGAAA